MFLWRNKKIFILIPCFSKALTKTSNHTELFFFFFIEKYLYCTIEAFFWSYVDLDIWMIWISMWLNFLPNMLSILWYYWNSLVSCHWIISVYIFSLYLYLLYVDHNTLFLYIIGTFNELFSKYNSCALPVFAFITYIDVRHMSGKSHYENTPI